jgi:hypothetical protein
MDKTVTLLDAALSMVECSSNVLQGAYKECEINLRTKNAKSELLESFEGYNAKSMFTFGSVSIQGEKSG